MKPQSQHNQRGFTLIEVLVSLLIFSTAILALMRAGTENLKAISILEKKQIAGIVADNQLLLATSHGKSQSVGTVHESVEMAGRTWHWNIKTEKTAVSNYFRLTAKIREGKSEQVILTRIAFAAQNQPKVQ